MPRRVERQGITVEMTEQDLQLLKDHTVDFISFSYYASQVASGIQLKGKKQQAISLPLKNLYLESSEWGWQIDPLVSALHEHHLRIVIKTSLYRRKWTRCR